MGWDDSNDLRTETTRTLQRALERRQQRATLLVLAAALPVVLVVAALGPRNPLHYLALMPVMVAVSLWLRAIPRQHVTELPFYRALLSGDVAWLRRAEERAGLLPAVVIDLGTRSGRSHRIAVARRDAQRTLQLFGRIAPWACCDPTIQPYPYGECSGLEMTILAVPQS